MKRPVSEPPDIDIVGLYLDESFEVYMERMKKEGPGLALRTEYMI